MAVMLNGLGKRLVTDQVLTLEEAQQATTLSKKNRVPFVTQLVDSDMASASDIAEVASDEFGTPVLDLTCFNMELLQQNLVDAKLVHQHRAFP